MSDFLVFLGYLHGFCLVFLAGLGCKIDWALWSWGLGFCIHQRAIDIWLFCLVFFVSLSFWHGGDGLWKELRRPGEDGHHD